MFGEISLSFQHGFSGDIEVMFLCGYFHTVSLQLSATDAC